MRDAVTDLRARAKEAFKDAVRPAWTLVMSKVRVRRSALGSGGRPDAAGSARRKEWADAEWFSAYLDDPRGALHDRGFFNARLGVFNGGLVIVPSSLNVLLHGRPDPIEYRWPAVVLKTRPLSLHAVLLVDVRGQTGACVVYDSSRLRLALSRSGMTVIEVRRARMTGRVQPRDLGEHVNDVPPSVVRG